VCLPVSPSINLTEEVFTALVIVFVVLIAEVLEELTVGRGRRAIQDLLKLLPREVKLRRADGVRSANSAELKSGDVVLVRPGGRVPVDGVVTSGHSFIESGGHYRRIHASREDSWRSCLCRNRESILSSRFRLKLLAVIRPLARSSRRLNRPSVLARLFRERPIAWQATWSTSPWLVPFSHSS